MCSDISTNTKTIISSATCHMSPAMCHLSPVTCHQVAIDCCLSISSLVTGNKDITKPQMSSCAVISCSGSVGRPGTNIMVIRRISWLSAKNILVICQIFAKYFANIRPRLLSSFFVCRQAVYCFWLQLFCLP